MKEEKKAREGEKKRLFKQRLFPFQLGLSLRVVSKWKENN